MTTVSQAVQQVQQTPIQLVRSYEQRFAAILPSHLKSETFMTLALGALKNDELAKAARNNPLALVVALTNCARLGHQPNTEAFYLVPFKGVITGIEGYRGVVERLYRSGGVSSVHARVVRANDFYEFEEGMDHPIHRYKRFAADKERGDRIGVFAYARLLNGNFSEVIEFNRDAVMARKAASPGSKSEHSPWNRWEDSMWLKCPTRELEKWVPSSAEYRQQVLLSNAAAADLATELGAPAPDDRVMDGEVISDGDDWPPTAAPGGE
ncbi:MAG TPA: recombinase RecT [Candidatus Limnocylindrales bacterium]|nr:recombinase RecT [Candidatus Limnocylindrales bacterium]